MVSFNTELSNLEISEALKEKKNQFDNRCTVKRESTGSSMPRIKGRTSRRWIVPIDWNGERGRWGELESR